MQRRDAIEKIMESIDDELIDYGVKIGELTEKYEPTKPYFIVDKWQVKADDEWIDITADAILEGDIELRVVWKDSLVEVSTLDQFREYAPQYVNIKLTDDIVVPAGEAYWSADDQSSVRSVIRTLNAKVDGNGHKITLAVHAGGALHNLGFIDTISETALLRNVVIEGTLGSKDGAAHGAAGQAKLALVAFRNQGTIEDCYFTGTIYSRNHRAQESPWDWGVELGNGTCGSVIYNEGTMQNLLVNINVEALMSHEWGVSENISEHQKFAFAVCNSGTVKNCLAVNELAQGNEENWMTSNLNLGTYANGQWNHWALDGWAKEQWDIKNHADENRENCYVYGTFDKLLAGEAKGDNYIDGVFDNQSFASVTVKASDILGGAWTITSEAIKLGNIVIYDIYQNAIEVDTLEELKMYASQNVTVRLTSDIEVAGSEWADVDGIRSVIPNLNARIDGNGHKITIVHNGDQSQRYKLGFIGTIAQNASLRNVIIEATYGNDGWMANAIGLGKLALVAYYNQGTIENCYFTGTIFTYNNNARENGYGWGENIQNGTCGTIIYNEGTIKGVIVDISVRARMADGSSWSYGYEKLETYQKFAFAVSNSGTVENCLVVNNISGGDESWMTSSINFGEPTEDGWNETASANWTNTEFKYKNHADENRENCYVFASYEALLAGTAKGDNYVDGIFDNTSFAEVTVDVAEILGGGWTIVDGKIKLGDAVIYGA